MQQAKQEPEKYVVDPIKKKLKKEQDQQRRIDKKLKKKQIEDQEKLQQQIVNQSTKKNRHLICLHCRKRGHTVAECRIAQEVNAEIPLTSRICYNCGSTEHTLYECPKKRRQTLEFAVCFVCKQKGHISRDCPQNENGLYAEGGGCFICGDVHHIKRDCPQNQDKYYNNVDFSKEQNNDNEINNNVQEEELEPEIIDN